MKIGIFWGSFDPPHMGHVFAAVQFLKTTVLDEIWVIPVFKHPFGKELTSFGLRVCMCCEAFNDIERLRVLDVDSNNQTNDCIGLLRLLHQQVSLNEYIMLGGSDVNAHNDKHKDIEEIKKLCTIARVPRASYTDNRYSIPNYSSSEIRGLINEGKSIQGLVPLLVENIIMDMGLYKNPT